MKYIYGPLLSRRLGQSLGVDPIPLKTCNWNCIYCQLGRTAPLVNERQDYFPPEEIVKELKIALRDYPSYQIDWVTIVGSGEPLLCLSIGWLIQQFKALTRIPIAVITSGSLLYLPEVRRDILSADAVLPSLNAGAAGLYKQIHRPHPEITFEKYVEGLVKFSEEYQGKLWPELMLIQGLNDTEQTLKDIARILMCLRYDEVHINLPVRPPAEPWVKPSDQEGLMRAMAILGKKARAIRPIDENAVFHHYESWAEAIIGIVSRHPLREEELKNMLSHLTPRDVDTAIDYLKASGKIQIVERYGQRFWCGVSSYYPGETKKPRAPVINH